MLLSIKLLIALLSSFNSIARDVVSTENPGVAQFRYANIISSGSGQKMYKDETTINLSSASDKNSNVTLKFKKLHFLVAAEGDTDYGIDMVYGDDTSTHVLKNHQMNDEIMSKLFRIIQKNQI